MTLETLYGKDPNGEWRNIIYDYVDMLKLDWPDMALKQTTSSISDTLECC